MSRRYRPIGLLCLTLAFVSLLGYLWPAEKADPPVRVLLPNAGGPVVFNHAEHVKTGIDCQVCHHTSKVPVAQAVKPASGANTVALAEGQPASQKLRIPSCGKCHGVKVDEKFSHGHIVDLEDYQGACISCHHPMPLADRWGHKKHVAEYEVGCRSCHHKEKENIEDKPQSCANCHFSGISQRNRLDRNVFPGLADAVHARCASCHQKRFGQAFAKNGKETAKQDDGKGAGQKHPPLSECLFCHGPTSVTAAQKAAQKDTQASQQHQARAKLDKSATGIGRNPDIMRENCSSCHAESMEKLVPGRMDAFHRLCMGCHEKQGKGPYKSEAFAGPPTADPNLGRPVSGKPGSESCIQCHTGK